MPGAIRVFIKLHGCDRLITREVTPWLNVATVMETTEPAFRLCEDEEGLVVVEYGGTVRRLPLQLATTLWLRRFAERPPSSPFVVLSYAIHPDRTQECRTMLVFLKMRAMEGVAWPAWHPRAAPTCRTVRVGDWVALPGGEPHAVVTTATRYQQKMGRGNETGIRQRCDDVVRQGEDPDFAQSLDYYTTQRVKYAYLRLNAQGLMDRLLEVRNKRLDFLHALRASSATLRDGWTLPFDESASCVKDDTPDPNRLCVPQASDYVLPVDPDAVRSEPFCHGHSDGDGGVE